MEMVETFSVRLVLIEIGRISNLMIFCILTILHNNSGTLMINEGWWWWWWWGGVILETMPSNSGQVYNKDSKSLRSNKTN